MRLMLAFRCFFRALADANFAERLYPLLAPPSDTGAEAGEAVRLLAVLQRDGRLIDFLCEDISGCTDDQVGAAVRDIHRDCAAVLDKYLDLEPVIDAEEDEIVEVDTDFNPHRISLTGNVGGSPPFRGVLVHRGWRVGSARLPQRPEGSDPMLMAPAEVEIQ